MGIDLVLAGENNFCTEFFHENGKRNIHWKFCVLRAGQSGAVASLESTIAPRLPQAPEPKLNFRQSRAQLLSLAARILRAQESDRRRIAEELHDNINQKLAALALLIHEVSQEAEASNPLLTHQLEVIRQKVSDIIDDVRGFSYSLHPAVLEHTGLLQALRFMAAEFSQRTGIEVFLQLPAQLELPPDHSVCLYRIVQESLQNCARHSKANRVTILLRRVKKSVQLLVEDDGASFDIAVARDSHGLGIISIEERVRLFEGTFEIQSKANQGTWTLIELPLLEPAEPKVMKIQPSQEH
jgi:signal transduction histidine kinase